MPPVWSCPAWSRATLVGLALACASAGSALAEGPPPSGHPLKAVVFDIEPVALPATPAVQARLRAQSDLLRGLVAARGFTVVDTAPQAQRIAASQPLSQCGCDQEIARALGADIEIATAAQGVSAATFNLSGSVKDVTTDKVLRQGVVDVRGEDPAVWAHGFKFLVKERLFDPPLPPDAAALAAAVAGSGR